jgi:hypothetical protein
MKINLKSITSHFLRKYDQLMKQMGWEKEDLQQEIYMIIQEKNLEEHDNINFIITTIKNRLIDMGRRTVRRWKQPCLECPLFAAQKNKCLRFKEKTSCQAYAKFERAEMSRPNIANCVLFSQLQQNDVKIGAADVNDTFELVVQTCLETLEGEERALFLSWQSGDKLNSSTYERLVAIIREVLKRRFPHIDFDDPEMLI